MKKISIAVFFSFLAINAIAQNQIKTISVPSNQLIKQVANSSCLTGKINITSPGNWYSGAQLVVTSNCTSPQSVDQAVVSFNSNSSSISSMWGGMNSSSEFFYQGQQAQAVIHAPNTTLNQGQNLTLSFGANTNGTPFVFDSVNITPSGPTPPPKTDGEIDVTFNPSANISGTGEVDITSPNLVNPIVINNTNWSTPTTYQIKNLSYGNYTMSAKNIDQYAATVSPSSVNIQSGTAAAVTVNYKLAAATGALSLNLGTAPISNIANHISAILHDETTHQDQAVNLSWNQNTLIEQLPANDVFSITLPRVTNGKQYADPNAITPVTIVKNQTTPMLLSYQGGKFWNTQSVQITFSGLTQNNASLIITDTFQNQFRQDNLGNGSITQNLPINDSFAVSATAAGLDSDITPANFTLSEGKSPPAIQVSFSPAPQSKTIFAPYVDIMAWPMPDLTQIMHDTNNKSYSLAFIVQYAWGQGCAASWGGVTPISDSTILGNIKTFQKNGGNPIVSFGGATGSELAQGCKNNNDLMNAYQSVINTVGTKQLDFDIEGAAISDSAANDRRAKALAALQQQDPDLKVSFTLPVLTSGLTPDGVNLINNAKANGVKISYVNLMTMDYGGADDHMGQSAIDAANATVKQLSLPLSQIGITPMIGVNDVANEIFTFTDATLVKSFVQKNNVAFLGYWSVGRDKACVPPSSWVSPSCSGVLQTPYQFNQTLNPNY